MDVLSRRKAEISSEVDVGEAWRGYRAPFCSPQSVRSIFERSSGNQIPPIASFKTTSTGVSRRRTWVGRESATFARGCSLCAVTVTLDAEVEDIRQKLAAVPDGVWLSVCVSVCVCLCCCFAAIA